MATITLEVPDELAERAEQAELAEYERIEYLMMLIKAGVLP